MGTKLRFECEFEDQGPARIAYEISGHPIDKAEVRIEDQTSVLYCNKNACRVLAEVFAKLAIGSYKPGFHLHLKENFDSDDKEMLRIVLVPDDDRK